MIYVHKDGTGYTAFPVPADLSRFIPVDGDDEARVLNGDTFRLSPDQTTVEFLTTQEVVAEKLPDWKATKRQQIDQWRKGADRAGLSYQFPDGQSGTIQIRDTDDKANISGLVVAAQADPEGAFGFRDGEDVTRPMSAADIIAMGSAVQAFITGNYAKAWVLKDQVEAATTLPELEAITWE